MTHLNAFRSLAVRAYSGTSFSPERRAESTLSEYNEELAQDLQKIPDSEHDRYIKKYKSHFSDWIRSQGNVMSTMITGPANFPEARNEKRSRSADNKYQQFRDWRKRALVAIRRKQNRAMTTEEHDAREWPAIQRTIRRCASEIIKIDNGDGKRYQRTMYVTKMTGMIERIARNGRSEIVKKALDYVQQINDSDEAPKDVISQRNKFWTYYDLSEEIRKLSEQKVEEGTKEHVFGEVTIIENFAIDRIQIKFPGKPERDTIQELKGSGWRWSRFHGVWQRKLTQNAMYSAKQILNIS